MKKQKITKVASAESILKAALKGIEDKKGESIIYINLKSVENASAEYFVICQAQSRTQVEAIADSVEHFIKENVGENPWHVEGYQNAEWILLDYVNVVIHVFQPDARIFYNLEKLWADGEIHKV